LQYGRSNPGKKYPEFKSFKEAVFKQSTLLGAHFEAVVRHVSRVDKCLGCLEHFLFQVYYRPVVLITVTWQNPIGLYRLIFRNGETLSRLSGLRRKIRILGLIRCSEE
jgi:hypothetical protein